MRKSKSGKLASNISKASCGRYWRHCETSRAFNCDARTRKVQNPAKLCAIGEAMGCNLSRFHLSGRGGFDLRTGGFWRNAKKPIVNALNLSAYLPPIELGNYGRARVGSQFRGKRIAIVIWHNECIVQMAYTFGRTRKANDWFAC